MRLEQLLVQFSRIEHKLIDCVRPQQKADFSGKWKNEYGSVMELQISGSDVRGTYTSLVSDTGAPISGSIIGYQAGSVISFTVLWPSNPARITAWVGQLVTDERSHANEGERLETLWQMIVNVADAQNPESLWTTIHAGSDHFRRCK
jgi:hypothetical protein